jgi:phenylacetate-CoA oxygenase PaaH subunit
VGAPRRARGRRVIWEVFRQEREGAPFQHGGSLEAPDFRFAEIYAREFYGRRNESEALWIIPRDAVREVDEPYVADVFDRDYRRVDGYSLKAKLKEARERADGASAS